MFVSGLPHKVCLLGVETVVRRGTKDPKKYQRPTELIQGVLNKALGKAGLKYKDLDGLIAVPSLTEPHFME